MKPSSALILQLIEFEKRVLAGSRPNSTKFLLCRQFVAMASQNWIPLTIYFLVSLIIIKCIIEKIVPDNVHVEELVCK